MFVLLTSLHPPFAAAASASDQPFFVFLSFLKTHTAMFTTPAFTNVSESGVYGDNVEELGSCL